MLKWAAVGALALALLVILFISIIAFAVWRIDPIVNSPWLFTRVVMVACALGAAAGSLFYWMEHS